MEKSVAPFVLRRGHRKLPYWQQWEAKILLLHVRCLRRWECAWSLLSLYVELHIHLLGRGAVCLWQPVTNFFCPPLAYVKRFWSPPFAYGEKFWSPPFGQKKSGPPPFGPLKKNWSSPLTTPKNSGPPTNRRSPLPDKKWQLPPKKEILNSHSFQIHFV